MDASIQRRAKLLARFDGVARRARDFLTPRYGESFSDEVLADARQRLDPLISELPDIGGRSNQFTLVIEINGWIIAFHRAMKARGKTVEEVVRVCAEVADAYLASLPKWVIAIARWLAFSWPLKLQMRRQAARSQRRRYPADFVYSFEETAEGWTLWLEECAVHKLYGAQGLPELKPFCNFFDITYSRYLNMGIDATQTIGLGCERCRLAYRKNRETIVPETLRELLPAASGSARA